MGPNDPDVPVAEGKDEAAYLLLCPFSCYQEVANRAKCIWTNPINKAVLEHYLKVDLG